MQPFCGYYYTLNLRFVSLTHLGYLDEWNDWLQAGRPQFDFQQEHDVAVRYKVETYLGTTPPPVLFVTPSTEKRQPERET
jgi:hypothetical protein